MVSGGCKAPDVWKIFFLYVSNPKRLKLEEQHTRLFYKLPLLRKDHHN
jgi:hypothetical protein